MPGLPSYSSAYSLARGSSLSYVRSALELRIRDLPDSSRYAENAECLPQGTPSRYPRRLKNRRIPSREQWKVASRDVPRVHRERQD